MLIENILREDIQPIEEAITYKRLIDDHGYTHDALGGLVKLDKRTISRTLKLLTLPEEVQKHVVASPERTAVGADVWCKKVKAPF